jgi:MFS family permease
VVYASAAIIGHTLAPSAVLSTLPITVFVIGMALSTLPAGAIARRYGRRATFLAGSACGVLMGLLASAALMLGSFAGFCVAMLFGGAYAAVVLTFRFAAAESVASDLKPRALSLVLAGGVVAGVLGPQLVSATMGASEHAYAMTYIASAALALCAGIVFGA